MKTVDLVIIILTAVVSISLIVSMTGPLITGEPLSDGKAQLVAGLLSSVVTIINIYVGYHVGRRENGKH